MSPSNCSGYEKNRRDAICSPTGSTVPTGRRAATPPLLHSIILNLSYLSIYKGGGEGYQDIPGFCKSATLEDIRKHGHVLTPGRYVGAEAAGDDGEPFDEKMKRLTATLREQQAEAAKLDAAIAESLRDLGYGE